jgi:hypothetical protein
MFGIGLLGWALLIVVGVPLALVAVAILKVLFDVAILGLVLGLCALMDRWGR